MLKDLLRLYFLALKVLIVACLVGITGLIFANVVLRYGFNSSLFFSEELARLAFVWLVFAGSQLMLHENGHIGVDILISRASPNVAKYLLTLTYLLMLFATGLFLQGSWKQTLINLPVGAPSTGISMGLFYGAGLVFSIFSTVLLCAQLFKHLATPAGASLSSSAQGVLK
ncbi:TRAP transporter small permease [Pseudomonas grimontii]|uniref:TRAP transporter small permease n=2 Tax=Bacteria TaxID=2 RepID=UPI00387AA85C